MSSHPTGKIVISGQTPSQKNGKEIRQNWKTGTKFIGSNNRVIVWKTKALHELRAVKTRYNKGRVRIDYMFYVVDDAQRDLDNMIASVNDVLQQANALMTMKNGKAKILKGTGIIYGDHWQKLSIGSADAQIDRENPRAEMIITELSSQA